MGVDKDLDLCVTKCKSMCCTGLSIPISRPRTKDEIDELRFYIVHKNVKIYIRSHRWYILVDEKCENLGKNNLCKDYENRPSICRKFSNKECEYWGDYYDVLFNKDAELLEYLNKKGRSGAKIRKKK